MRILPCAALLGGLLLLPFQAAAGGPVFDLFAEKFAVGGMNDPDDLVLEDGWPAGLMSPAVMDSAWFEAARAVLRFPEGTRSAAMVSALGDSTRARSWLEAAAADLESPTFSGPVTGSTGPVLAFFSALEDDEDNRARTLALSLVDREGLSQAERVVWSLRASALGPETDPAWDAADEILSDCGPWDGLNTWTLAVALRRSRNQSPIPDEASEDHGRRLGRLSKNRLTPDDIESAPYSADLKAALGAISLRGTALAAHFELYPSPPARSQYQGWWLRGRRTLAKGAAAIYEDLAGRSDISPNSRVDLWRRASERRLLSGDWSAAYDDLVAAYEACRDDGVRRDVRHRLVIWSEQAIACALAHERTGDARRFMEYADSHVSIDDPLLRSTWRTRLEEGGRIVAPAFVDRVDELRFRFEQGLAPDAVAATATARAALSRDDDGSLWALWRRWGVALTSDAQIGPDRLAAARAYGDALASAASSEDCLGAALGRLAPHPDVVEDLWGYALAEDARRLTGLASPPRPSVVPSLLDRLRGSQADLHALLGAAYWMGDMHGTMKVASVLAGTGLTRDEKRYFLYPLPGPGPVRDALLNAENDPALLLAIARNESAFEPAVRSRAGALGFMQIMPFHYEGFGARRGRGHWSQPAASIARGDALVTENRRRYGGDPYRLLAAYNAGPEAAARWDRQLGGKADRAEFAAWIGYTETRRYVEKVLIDRDVYAWILNGSDH